MPFTPDSALDAAFRSLADLCDDFQQTQYGSGANVLQQMVALLDAEPLSSFIAERIPQIDYDAWLATVDHRRTDNPGRPSLRWPLRMPEKVATQLAIVRDLSQSERTVLTFTHDLTNAGYNDISAHYSKFGDLVLRPMIRDLERIAENRELPPFLAPATGVVPASGDLELDKLINEAIVKFQDRDPQSQAIGLERLWDGFERLKSVQGGDKKASVEALLNTVASDPAFREALNSEMLALTKIGNDFRIRHHETGKIELGGPLERDYLFHRMFALIFLLLTRSR